MKVKVRIAVILTAMLTMLLSACNTAETAPEKRTICVVLKAMDSVHWISVEDGLQQAANDYGVFVNILWPSSENDVNAQRVMIEDAIESKPDAVAIAPCDSEQTAVMHKAYEMGVPCFNIDTKSSQYDFTYIGSDNEHIGELAAKKFSETFNNGKVAVIMGSRRQSSHAERLKGFTTYIQTHTNLKLCEVKENPNSSITESINSMSALMTEHPDLKGVFCTSGMLVLGAMQECDRLDKAQIQLIGVDTQSDAMSGVEDGKILALIGQNGYQIGYQTIHTIVDALNGKEVESEVIIDNPIIMKDNVSEYLEEYLTERGEDYD